MTEVRRSVAILIFPGVELLDFAGPFEVFSAAYAGADRTARLLDVWTVAESAEAVRCHYGPLVVPDHTLDSCPSADLLVAPGGMGTRTAIDRPALIAWIAERAPTCELVLSVCTGSFLLAKAGLLAGRPATTHWASVERMRTTFPGQEVRSSVRWVDAGDVVSSAGVSAGIDMALYVLARLYGDETAEATARWIEYDYWPPSVGERTGAAVNTGQAS
jgi:transcriptional regulator GlxA family with amidase domain